MANVKITGLTSASVLTSDDLFPIVNDPLGVPVTQKITAQVLLNYITGSSINTLTATTITGSTVTGSVAKFTTITGSFFTGSIASITTITGSDLLLKNYSLILGNKANNYYVGARHGTSNVAIGPRALSEYSSSIGTFNVAVGVRALSNNTTGSSNIAIGTDSLRELIDGNYNIAIGESPLYLTKNSSYNIGIGYLAGISRGDNNVTIGTLAGAYYGFSGSNNIIIGGSGGSPSNTDITGNIIIGNDYAAGSTLTSTNNITILGNNINAASNLVSGSYNTFLGSVTPGNAITDTSLNNTVIIAAGNEKLRINSSGNVGIATNAPLTRLDVRSGVITAGSATSTNGSEILRGYYTAGATTVIGTENSSGGPVIGYAVKPGLTAGTFSSSAGINVGRSAYSIDGSSHRWYYGALQNVAENSAVTMTEAMRIDASGRLGIGTNSPVQTLSVTGTLGVSGNTTLTTISGTQAQFTGLTGTYTAPLGALATPSYTFVGDPNTGIYSPAADTLVFVEGGTEVIRISSNTAITASGPLTGSTALFTTITGSTVTGSTALFTTVTASTGMFINNGNLVFGTTGRGVDFSITPNSGTTTTSELFNDYEEGTWTPAISGTIAAGVYGGTSVGRYTKIGNTVTIAAYMALTTTNASTGTLFLTGLPFTVIGADQVGGFISNFYFNLGVNATDLRFWPNTGTSRANIYRTTAAINSSNTPLSNSAGGTNELGSSPQIYFYGFYYT